MRSFVVSSLGALALLAQQAQAAVLVDDFALSNQQKASADVFVPVDLTGPSALTQFGDAALGTSVRSGSVAIVGATSDAVASLTLGTNGGFETYSFDDSQITTATSTYSFEYTYSSPADFLDPTGGMGAPGIALVFTNFKLTGTSQPIELTVTVNNIASVTYSLGSPTSPPAAAADRGFLFSDFGIFAGQFGSVTSIRFTGNFAEDNVTVAADNLVIAQSGDEFAPFDPVPEPSTLALACMGLMGFGGYARRRMKARA